MTCAEARRRLPGRDAAELAVVREHLAGCDPCRAESDALREVDRRLGRLGAYRLLSTAEEVLQLDQKLGQVLGPAARRPTRRLLWLGLVILTAAALFVLRR